METSILLRLHRWHRAISGLISRLGWDIRDILRDVYIPLTSPGILWRTLLIYLVSCIVDLPKIWVPLLKPLELTAT